MTAQHKHLRGGSAIVRPTVPDNSPQRRQIPDDECVSPHRSPNTTAQAYRRGTVEELSWHESLLRIPLRHGRIASVQSDLKVSGCSAPSRRRCSIQSSERFSSYKALPSTPMPTMPNSNMMARTHKISSRHSLVPEYGENRLRYIISTSHANFLPIRYHGSSSHHQPRGTHASAEIEFRVVGGAVVPFQVSRSLPLPCDTL